MKRLLFALAALAVTQWLYLPASARVSAQQACDSSYPDFCIPPPPPDLDCAQIVGPPNFTVLSGDPHGLDGNPKNGRGCEKGTAGGTPRPYIAAAAPPAVLTPAVTSLPPAVASSPSAPATPAAAIPARTGSPSLKLALIGIPLIAVGVYVLFAMPRPGRHARR